jgi:hypothetical protein
LGNLNKFIERSKSESESFETVEKEIEKVERFEKDKRFTMEPIKETNETNELELDANEQRALVHDIERLKKNNNYTPEEEQKSKQSILDLKKQLKEGNISKSDYDKLLIPQPEPLIESTPILKELKNEFKMNSDNESNETNETNELNESNEGEGQGVDFMSDASDEDSNELKEYTPVPTEVKKINLVEKV